MFYPGWIAMYFAASILSQILGVPMIYVLAFIVGTWYFRDKIDLSRLQASFGQGTALREAQRQAELNPRNAEAQSQAGLLLVERERHAEAVPHLRAALERMAASAEVNYLLGTAVLRTEGAATAEPYLSRAVELEPRVRQGDAQVRLAEALEGLGRGAEAYERLMDFFGEDTSNIEVLYRMGSAARAAGREEEAVRAFAAVKKAYGTNPAFRRGRDRPWAMKARRALGEKLVLDHLTVSALVVVVLLFYVWRLLQH